MTTQEQQTTMVIGPCSEYVWWEAPSASPYRTAWGNCFRADEPGALMHSEEYRTDYVTTASNFGCVQWEARLEREE